MVMLYHYTDIDGLEGILDSGVIQIGYARYGYGVYFTAMRPRAGPFRILRNNYDDDKTIDFNPRIVNKASYFIKIHSSELDRLDGVIKLRGPELRKRSVYLYEEDIFLDEVEYEIGETPLLKWSRCLYDTTGCPVYVGLVEDY